jgi:hypothetical protein
MVTEVYANDATATLTSGGNTTPTQGTVETWTVNVTTAFVSAVSGVTQFHIVDTTTGKTTEKILVTVGVGTTGSQTWTVTRGAESTTPVAHAANAVLQQVVTAGVLGNFVIPKPYQFFPETYGAKGYSGIAADIVTNGTTTITSATANWTGHNGEHIMINGASGTTSGPLLTTITSGGNGTATLANAASASATGCAAVWGPDDQAAINSAMSALSTYALANNYYGELYLSTFYVCASSPTQTSSPAVQNSQIPIPYPNVNGQSRKLNVSIKGPSNGGQLQYWESVFPNLQGAGIISMVTAPSTPSGTFGEQSVIGGPSGSSGLTGSFANTKVFIDGVTVWTPILTNMYVYDFGYTSALEWGSFSHQSFAPANNLSGATAAHPYLGDLPGSMVTQLENTIGVGCRFPLVGNNDDVVGTSFASEGILIGAIVGDHFTCPRVATLYVDVCGRIDLVNGISADGHTVVVNNWSAEAYNGGITCNGGGTGYTQVNINLDTEPIGGADPVYDVNDNGNLYGVIRIGDNGARTNRRPIILNGAKNLKIINDMLGPGFWSGSPAAPGSTSSQQNTSWREAWITLSATTGITVITVDSQTTGLVSGNGVTTAIRVPSGKSYAVTYSGTLTTKWWLD